MLTGHKKLWSLKWNGTAAQYNFTFWFAIVILNIYASLLEMYHILKYLLDGVIYN